MGRLPARARSSAGPPSACLTRCAERAVDGEDPPNTHTPSEALDAIEAAASDGFKLACWLEDRQRWQEKAFAFRDDQNAARVVATIEERVDRA